MILNKFQKLQKLFGAKGSKASLVHYGMTRGERRFTLLDASEDFRISKVALNKAISDLVEIGIFEEELRANRKYYFLVKSKEMRDLIGES